MPENNTIIFNSATGRMEIEGADKSTPVFNWALENSEKTKAIYESIWTAVLGNSEGFEDFYNKCRQTDNMSLSEDKSKIVHADGTKISGTTFQSEVIRRLTEADKQKPKDQQLFEYDEKGRLENSSIRKIGAKALQNLNINSVESQSLNTNMVRIYLSQMAVDGYFPFDTVATAGQAVSEGNHLQMGCGEGKTGVLVFAAAHQAMKDKQVFLTSSTTNLATDTMVDTLDKYELMGFNKDKDGNIEEQVVLITDNKVFYPLRDQDGNIVHKDKNGNIVSANKGKPAFIEINLSSLTLEERKKVLNEAYSKKIVIADNGTVMQDDMGGFIPAKDTDNRVLYADEADYVLLDQFRPAQQKGGIYPKGQQDLRQAYRQLARKVMLDFKAQYPEGIGFNKDDANQYCDFTAKGKAALHAIIAQLSADLKAKQGIDLDQQLFADFTYEALVVEEVYKDTRDYQVVTDVNKNKIIMSEDRASGARILDLPQGIAQALAIKEGTVYPAEHQVLNSTNVSAVFKRLFGKNQVCVSGTLNTSLSDKQSEELKEKTDGVTYDCSARDINSRQMNPKKIFASTEQRRQGTVNAALVHRTQNMIVDEKGVNCYQPVLIGCVSEEEVSKTVELLKSQHSELGSPRIITFTATSEHSFALEKTAALKDTSNLEGKEKEDAEKAKAQAQKAFIDKYGVEPGQFKDFNTYVKNYCGMSNSNCIVVGTSILGRGTTVKLGDKDVDKDNLQITKNLGGIHVIINGLHETSSRNQIQYAARAARGEDPGSVDEYMSIDEFDPAILKEKGIFTQGNEILVRHEDGSVTPISQKEIDNLYETQYIAIDNRQSNVRTHLDNLIANIEAQKEIIEEKLRSDLEGKYSEEEINLRVIMAVSFMTQRGFSILNRACGHDGVYKDSEYAVEMEAFANLYIDQYSQPDPKTYDPFDSEKGFFNRAGLKEKYMAVADAYFDFSVEQKVEILKQKGISEDKIATALETNGITKDKIISIIQSSELTKEDVSAAWNTTAEALNSYRLEYDMSK